MSPQADYVVSNGTGAAVRSDINGQLAAIVSNNSGASAPATTYAYMLWADTSTNLLKLRNGANSAWITVGDLTAANLGLAALASPTFTGTATIPTLTVSTAANIPLGSAASPTLYFTGDSNTGLYSPGADQVALSTGGTGRLFINSSGAVGIGTSSPGDKLHVAGNALFGTGASAVTIGGTTAAPSGPTDKNLTLSAWSATSGTNEYGGDLTLAAGRPVGGGSGVTGSVYIKVGKAGVGSTGLGTVVDAITASIGTLTFKTDDTERLRIDSSGRVGIGSTSPGRLVTIDGGASAAYLQITNTAAGSALGNGVEIFCDGTNGGLINRENGYLEFDTNNTERARIDSSGRLLVGTSSSRGVQGDHIPQIQLEGTGYASSTIGIIANSNDANGSYLFLGKSRGTTVGSNTIVQNNDALGQIRFIGSDGVGDFSNGATIEAAVDGTPGSGDLPTRLVFSTTADGASSPTERMRIKQNGFTKITSSGNFFSVNGPYHEILGSTSSEIALAVINTASTEPYGILLKFPNASPNDATRYFLHCEDSTGSRALIRSNGGLANYQANNVNLSDINTKKDITPAAGTWNCIKEWEIVNYRYKDQPDDSDLNLGVIAQQVAESCPEVITVFSEAKNAKPAVLDDDGNEVEPPQEAQPEKLGVKEQQMYWMAIKALQEAQVRIEALEAEVAALKAQ